MREIDIWQRLDGGAEVLARVDACLARGPSGQHNPRYDLERTREHVARGAKHFWSNA